MVVVRSSAPYALMYPWSAFLNCYCYLEVVPYGEGVKGGAEGSTEELSGVVSGKVCEGWKGAGQGRGGDGEGMRGGRLSLS